MNEERFEALRKVWMCFDAALKDAGVSDIHEMGTVLGCVLDKWQIDNGLSFEKVNDMLEYVASTRKEVNEDLGPWLNRILEAE